MEILLLALMIAQVSWLCLLIQYLGKIRDVNRQKEEAACKLHAALLVSIEKTKTLQSEIVEMRGR